MTTSRFVLIPDYTLSGRLLAGNEVEITVSIEIEQLDSVELDAFGTADGLPNHGLSREKNTGLFAVGVLTGDDEWWGDEQEKNSVSHVMRTLLSFAPLMPPPKERGGQHEDRRGDDEV